MERNDKGQFIKGKNVIDLSGRRFGKLKILRLDKERTKRKSYWICECECGNVKSIRGDTLNVIQSCGCVKKQQDKINLGIKDNHNMTYHPAFAIWDSMMNRCFNPKSSSYKNYGERGITVCEEWKDVKIFCKWMDDNNYNKTLSIERKDVNGNYEPSNCCLIPKEEQVWNTRVTRYIEIDGRKIPVAKTAREIGINPNTVWDRWKRGIRDYDRLFFKGNLQTEYKK